MREQNMVRVPRGVGLLLTLGGVVGLIASLVLTVDKIHLLQDPSYVPGCFINAEFSCGSVMTSWQASLFGFPNSLVGLVGFAVVTALGVVVATGTALPRWIWWGLQFGVLAAVVFIHWLMVQSIFDIEALCLYCMAVWAVTIPMFTYVTAVTVLSDPARHHGPDDGSDEEGVDDEGVDTAPGSATVAVHLSPRLVLIPLIWLAGVAALIVIRFG